MRGWLGSAPVQVGECSAPVLSTVLSSVAGQPSVSLSAFLCTHQSVDLLTVFMLGGFSVPLSTSSRTVLRQPALGIAVVYSQGSPHSQHYVPSLYLSLPAMLLHFLLLVPSCLPSLSQRYRRNSLGTTLCKENTQSIPPLPAVRWEKVSVSPQKKKGFWHWLAAQLDPGRAGRGGSWQALAAPPAPMHPPSMPRGENIVLQDHGDHENSMHLAV